MYEVSEIIEALEKHQDPSSIGVLERVGTNCSDAKVRERTIKALINKNTHDSIKLLIVNEGKGINDMNPDVAMFTVNELKNLSDKTEAIKILNDTINLHSSKIVKNNAIRAKLEILN